MNTTVLTSDFNTKNTYIYISGTQSQLSKDEIDNLSKYRYKVFVETLGWELDTPKDSEKDQFDHKNTAYVFVKNQYDHICGCGRLLPTTSSYLLNDVFPQLLHGQPAPCSEDVWELSRFACVDFDVHQTAKKGQFSSELGIRFLRKVLQYAKTLGASQVVTVSPIAVERLLINAGFEYYRLGKPVTIDGYSLVGLMINAQIRD